MTILHIFTGLTTFLKLGRDCFESAGIPGEYVVIGRQPTIDSSGTTSEIQYYQLNSDKYYEFLGRLTVKNYSLVLFHSLLLTNATVALDLIKNQPERPPLSWDLYGAEISMSDIFPHHFHGPLTNRIYYKLAPYRIFIPVQRILQKLFNRSLHRVFKGMDYIVHFMPEEIKYFEQYSNIKRPSLWFIYSTIEGFVGKDLLDKKVVKRGNILIGNSSSFTSNHAEAFELISGADFQDRKVIVPLSYGNMKYAGYINEYGKKVLGDNFTPLNDFMKLNEYNALYLTCSCVIMNHYRQQAIGNIISAAWLGARIYVNEFTTIYTYFKRIGIHIFSLQRDFQVNDSAVFDALSDEQIAQNRIVLQREFGSEKVIADMKISFAEFIEK